MARSGFDVEVLGGWVDGALKARDQQLIRNERFRFTAAFDLTERGPAAIFAHPMRRVTNKVAHIAHSYLGLENRWQLGPAVTALGRLAAKREPDLLIAHSEAALFVAHRMLSRGRRVGIDMEDWYSEDLLPSARRHRPIGMLRKMEADLLRSAAHATCPSEAMSRGLSAAYECHPPLVVYNAFPLVTKLPASGGLLDRCDQSLPSIHWYSQTIGPGRGLEDLLLALPLLGRTAEIHLRGHPAQGVEAWIHGQLPEAWRHRVFLHGLVDNDQLALRITEHDIGFAGEMKYCRSRDLTVTNKIMQYLVGGLAVVASDTEGQREVSEQAPGAVTLYPSGDPKALAACLDHLLASPDRLDQAKAAALVAAEQTFCWPRQEERLLMAVEKALALPASKV